MPAMSNDDFRPNHSPRNSLLRMCPGGRRNAARPPPTGSDELERLCHRNAGRGSTNKMVVHDYGR